MRMIIGLKSRIIFLSFLLISFLKISSLDAQEPNFVELKSNQIGFCKDDEFSIDQSKLTKSWTKFAWR